MMMTMMITLLQIVYLREKRMCTPSALSKLGGATSRCAAQVNGVQQKKFSGYFSQFFVIPQPSRNHCLERLAPFLVLYCISSYAHDGGSNVMQRESLVLANTHHHPCLPGYYVCVLICKKITWVTSIQCQGILSTYVLTQPFVNKGIQ